MQWKDFFYFSKRQRRGILLLISLIFLASSGLLIYQYIVRKSHKDSSDPALQAQFNAFKSKQEQKKIPHPKLQTTSTPKTPFDPNTNSLEELINSGVPKHLAQNIINYRVAGGVFYKKEDLKKLYTITPELYAQLEELIQIKARKPQPVKQIHRAKSDTLRRFSPTPKFSEGTLLTLNSCDTTALKKIPGIGSYTAQKITRYQERLGGYYSTAQLQEIGIGAELLKWFVVDSTQIRRIALNDSSFKALVRHPYLSYEQVKAIFNLKRKQGKIKSIKQLQLLEVFDAYTLERLAPYLSFN